MAQALGKRAEDAVANYLQKQGLLILERNKTYYVGEIDIVARDGETLVFVEVKYRKNMDFGAPYEAVTTSKQKKIIRAAQVYLQGYRIEPVCRFDVISVLGDVANPRIEHLRDAFWIEDE